MSVTIRQLSRHTSNQPPVPLSLRQMLRLERTNLRLQVKQSPFSIMTQNMALLPFPTYNGTDRFKAIFEIVSRIIAISPDVVGLCEVFNNQERETIRTLVKHIYPHFQEGPDEEGFDLGGSLLFPFNPIVQPHQIKEDGGLLLLSKHPILQHLQITYDVGAGMDMFSNKGVIHIRVQPPGSPMPYDIFYSHTQDIEANGGTQALYAQLTTINNLIQTVADPNIPALVVGDLNIPGEVPEHYNQLISRLGNPVDFWTVAGNRDTAEIRVKIGHTVD